MNIFVLDLDPVKAAQMLCDKHCSKMVLETAQLLSLGLPGDDAPYRPTHINHPCAVWLRESVRNYEWLCRYGIALSDEFLYRRGKTHKSSEVILICSLYPVNLPDTPSTEFAQAMPDEYKIQGNAVRAYRNYYLHEKASIAKWEWKREAPIWYMVGRQEINAQTKDNL